MSESQLIKTAALVIVLVLGVLSAKGRLRVRGLGSFSFPEAIILLFVLGLLVFSLIGGLLSRLN